jgi:orotidine-5'-phosphate decarboxylase
MNRQKLRELIFQRSSYLCVGLDTDLSKLPTHLNRDAEGMWEFNKAIIDATRPYAVAYKINTAFYEALGIEGWKVMDATVRYIGDTHFTIADAKRGDIGNTADQYARAFFDQLPFDSITVAPYMGADSVKPFLQRPGKWAIVLGLTSNPGAADFEMKKLEATATKAARYLYEEVLETVSGWGSPENLMFVVGATQATEFDNIRRICPDHFLLVPGVGAQGGSLEEISRRALNKDGGLLVNASRAIIFASSGEDFAEKAAEAAEGMKKEMEKYLLIR